MKLRLRHNSIRLRLTQTEMNRLAETGRVEEVIEFGTRQRFIYALERSSEINEIEARLENNCIVILIPQKPAETWISTNQVGFETEQSIGDNRILRILIEKDFACLEPRPGSDDVDTLPHPLGSKIC